MGHQLDCYCSGAAAAAVDGGRKKWEGWGVAGDGSIWCRSRKNRKSEVGLGDCGRRLGREAGKNEDICP